MSLAILKSRAQLGTDAPPVSIEVFLSGGLPVFSIVGMPETAVRESKDRVRGAILSSGFKVGDVNLSVGYTGYFYTGDFDDTYQEINLGAGFGLLTLDVAIGEYENFDGPTQDYTFYSLTLEKSGFYGKFGGFSQDFEGEYFELGYSTAFNDIDVGLSLIFSNEDLVGENDEAIVFTIGKTFDL